MARKSRKNTGAIIEAPVQECSYFATAIYVRLSIENSGKNDEGDSIANQISFCKAYLAEHTDLKLYGIYKDNGEKGEFLPAFAPYGYVKSKTVAYRYEIDMETAPYVRMIFEWKAEGVSHNEICKRLNDMGAVTPARRKVDLGIWRAEKYKHTVWYGRTIIDIMKNPTYTGCIVYGRIPKSLYQGIKMHRAPEEEWRYIPDAHEPIVSQELFDKVQQMFAERAEQFKQKMDENAPLRELVTNHFKGKIYCGDCGKRMRFVKPTDKRYPIDQNHATYVCGGYLDSGYSRCSRHSIRYPAVADSVLAAIKAQVDFTMKQELKKINGKREALFENFAEGILDEAEYQFAKKKYDDEAVILEKRLNTEKAKKAQLDDVLSLSNEWIQAIRQAENVTEVDDGLVKHLISAVKVFEEQRVEVELLYGEQRSILNQVINEMVGEENE